MLRGGGLGDLGPAVPDVAVPEAGQRVDVGAALGVVDGGSLAAVRSSPGLGRDRLAMFPYPFHMAGERAALAV